MRHEDDAEPVGRPMQPSVGPHNSRARRNALQDQGRLASLKRLGLDAGASDPAFEPLARLAQQIIGSPVCLISVVDDHAQYFKAAVGLGGPAAETRQTPLSHSFCQHVVISGRPLIVEDARIDPLVRDNLAIRDLSIIAYMGVPVRSPDGFVLGSFCVIDSQPRAWKPGEVELLQQFSQLVTRELAAREERMTADAALQASNEQLHRLLGRADCLLWEAEVTFTKDDWPWRFSIQPSGLFDRIYGEPAPPKGSGLWNQFELPDRVAMDRRSRNAMLEGRPGYDQEFRVVRNGVMTWIRESVTIRRDGPDKFRLVGVATDVTALRQTQSALSAAQAQLQVVLENAGVGIASIDASGLFTTWNPAMEEMTGWTEGDVLGHESPSLIIAADEASRLARAHVIELPGALDGRTLIQAALGRGDRCVWETSCLRRDGRSLPVSLHLGVISSGNGAFAGGVLVVQDLTERIEIESKLAHARDEALESLRLKSQFLANVSHEIRTPMNGIMGMAGLLMESRLDDQQRAMAQVILSSADSLLEIINDILDFSRIEAGRLKIDLAPFDLGALVEDAAILLAPRAHEKRLELACDIENDVPQRIVGDATRVRQVVMNLASNAVKFTDQGEVLIRVSLRRPIQEGRASLRIAIRDTGPGIAPATGARLFQPFVQGDGSHTRRHGGTGLGLAISRQLAELMGGVVAFESAPGHGSEFWFDFEAAAACLAESRSAVGTPGRVLVVDDNATSREILVRQVAAMEIPVESAGDATQAIEMLRAAAGAGAPYSVALLDGQMPGIGGIELAEWIRADAAISATPLVLLSPSGPMADSERASALEIERFMVKPVRAARLRATVLELLAGSPGAPGATGEPGSPVRERASSGAHILLAEDNPANQLVARMLLQRLGCRVDVVPNGQLALERLGRIRYDAVLMDCQMPVLDGYSATRAIRSGQMPGIDPAVPVVALTAYAMSGDRMRCVEAGMNDYLTKPLRTGALEEALIRLGLATRSVREIAAEQRTYATPAEDPSMLDQTVLAECRSLPGRNGRTMLADIVDLYLELEPSRMDEIAAAVDRSDMPGIASTAHTLAGSCANLGAVKGRAALLELEARALAADEPGVRAQFERVRAALAAVRHAVHALRHDGAAIGRDSTP